MDSLETIHRSLPSEITGAAGKLLKGFIPYNAPATIVERGKRFTEVIRPGAFARALAGQRDVISTFNHNSDRMLGRTSSGTLRLMDAADGLHYEVDLPESAGDVRELLARGDLKGSSFTAFPLRDGGEKWTPPASRGGLDMRELLSLELIELGPVVMPAYLDSDAAVRGGNPQAPPAGGSLAAALVGLMRRT